MKTTKTILVFIALINVFSFQLMAQKKFELADYAKLVGITDPQISPDGKSVVIVVSKPDYINNRSNAELVLVDVVSGSKKSLTSPERFSVSSPRWSPNGEELAFISKASSAKDAQNQIFVLSMKGGEAKQMTKAPKGVQHFSWSPNSTDIAYATLNEPKNKAEIEKGFTAFEIANNDMFVGSQPQPAHIWIANTNTLENKRLTDGDWSVPQIILPSPQPAPFSWSADGKAILFLKVISPYSGDAQSRNIQLLNVEDGTFKPLTSRTKFENSPSFSPDATKIAYWYKKDGKNLSTNQLWIADAKGGEGKAIATQLDIDLSFKAWMPEGKNILVGGNNDNKTSLFNIGLDGKSSKIDLGNLCSNLNASISNTGAIVFTGTEPNKPVVLYYMASTSSKIVQLTEYNSEVSKMTFGKAETIRWENDGFKQNGIVTYPVIPFMHIN